MSFYRINVSQNSGHFFATASHSITNVSALRQVLPVIVEKFPGSQGFEVSVSYEETSGRGFELGPLLTACLKSRAETYWEIERQHEEE